MTITLNEKKEIINKNTSIFDFLKSKDIKLEQVIIEYNSVITKRDNWKNIILKENDNLEVLRFVGGG